MDWVMFNPNTSLYIYCNLEFTYRTNGKIIGNLMLEGFRQEYALNIWFWYLLFVLMWIYLTISFIREVYK